MPNFKRTAYPPQSIAILGSRESRVPCGVLAAAAYCSVPSPAVIMGRPVAGQ